MKNEFCSPSHILYVIIIWDSIQQSLSFSLLHYQRLTQAFCRSFDCEWIRSEIFTRPDRETLNREIASFDLIKWQTYMQHTQHLHQNLIKKMLLLPLVVTNPIKMEQNFIIEFSACNLLYRTNFILSLFYTIFSSQCRWRGNGMYLSGCIFYGRVNMCVCFPSWMWFHSIWVVSIEF